MYTVKGQLDRSALIKQYQPLVRKLAHYMMAKLPPSVEVDDLIQVGLIGLADALSRLLSDEPLRLRLADAAAANANSEFTMDSMRARHLAIFASSAQ
jgi:hypothetical protein